MTDGLKAHLRLIERLRDRTRTHLQEKARHVKGEKYTADEKAGMRAKLLRLKASGLNRRDMASMCGTTNKTIVRLLGTTRRGRTPKC